MLLQADQQPAHRAFPRMGLGLFRRRGGPPVIQLNAAVAPEASVCELEAAASGQEDSSSSLALQLLQRQQRQTSSEGWLGPIKGALPARWAIAAARSPSEASLSVCCISECEDEDEGAAEAPAQPDCRQRFGIDFLRRVPVLQNHTPPRLQTVTPAPLCALPPARHHTPHPDTQCTSSADTRWRHTASCPPRCARSRPCPPRCAR